MIDFSEDIRFAAGKSDFIMDDPIELMGGLFLLCESGEAELVLDCIPYHIQEGEEAIILTKKSFYVTGNRNFISSYFYCGADLIRIAYTNFNSLFFNSIDENPVFRHTTSTIETSQKYFNLILEADRDQSNKYREVIISNLVRNLLLYIYNGIQSSETSPAVDQNSSTHLQTIFDAFMDKVYRHSIHHRDVDYYARKLCISSRYLNSITRTLTGQSPKEVIDIQAINEIKTMLLFTDKTIGQIADSFHFPDPSCLGRYFKKIAGCTPMEFRKSALEHPTSESPSLHQ